MEKSWLKTLDSFMARIITRMQEVYREEESDREAVKFALEGFESEDEIAQFAEAVEKSKKETMVTTSVANTIVIGSGSDLPSLSKSSSKASIPDEPKKGQKNIDMIKRAERKRRAMKGKRSSDSLNMGKGPAPMTPDERVILLIALKDLVDDAYMDLQKYYVVFHGATKNDLDLVYTFLFDDNATLRREAGNDQTVDTLPWIWNWCLKDARKVLFFFLDIISVHEERIRPIDPKIPICGFINSGNTCYLSSLLTAMFAKSNRYDHLLLLNVSVRGPDGITRLQKRFSKEEDEASVKPLVQTLFMIVHRMRQGRLIGKTSLSLFKQELQVLGFYSSAKYRECQQDVLELYQWLMNTLKGDTLSFSETLYHGAVSSTQEDQRIETEYAIVVSIDDGSSANNALTSNQSINSTSQSFNSISPGTDQTKGFNRRLSKGIASFGQAMLRLGTIPRSDNANGFPFKDPLDDINNRRSLTFFLSQHFFANRITGIVRSMDSAASASSNNKTNTAKGSRTNSIRNSNVINEADQSAATAFLTTDRRPVSLTANATSSPALLEPILTRLIIEEDESSNNNNNNAAAPSAGGEVRVDAWKMIQLIYDPFNPVSIVPMALKRYVYCSNSTTHLQRSNASLAAASPSLISPLLNWNRKSTIASSPLDSSNSSMTNIPVTSGPGSPRKDDKFIDIPYTINFNSFVTLHPNYPGTELEKDSRFKMVDWKLHLNAAICHTGSSQSVQEGHYTCLLRDSSIASSSEDPAQAPNSPSRKRPSSIISALSTFTNSLIPIGTTANSATTNATPESSFNQTISATSPISSTLAWLKMDDLNVVEEDGLATSIQKIPEEEAKREISRNAYLLFYELVGVTEKTVQEAYDAEVARKLQNSTPKTV